MPPSNAGVTVIIAGQDDTGPVLDQLEKRLQAAATSGERVGQAFAHSGNSTIAASVAFQTLDGRLPIRGLERVASMVPGLSAAFEGLLVPLAAIDFGRMVGEGVEKVVQWYNAAKAAGSAIAAAYQQSHLSASIANDDLRISNDRLENEIAKLEHKPQNNLKLALDEDRKSADELAESLDKAADKSKELLEKNAVGSLKASVTGQASTNEVAGSVNYFRGEIGDLGNKLSDATASGDKNAIAQARKNLTDKQNAYAKWLDDQIHDRQSQQNAANAEQRLYGVHNDNDQTANLNILRGERRSISDSQEHQQLQTTNTQLTSRRTDLENGKAAGDAAAKAEEAARKLQDAQNKLTAAEVSLADASARREEQAGKSQFAFLLDANEAAHKQLLESDEQYYRDKAQIQSDAIRSQQALLNTQQGNLQGQLGKLQAEPIIAKNPQDRQAQMVERNAKVAELKAKIVELDGKSADLTAQQAKNTAQLAEELDALSRKRVADADAIAAKLEGERGGSTQARSQQSRDEYQERRKAAVAEFGTDDAPAVQDLDAQQVIDQAGIGVTGAQQAYSAQASGIQVQRKGVDDAEARGQISDQSAREQRIALDREEAAALQPVLAAYQQLAAAGDLQAAEKVAELQQKIAELQQPVNQVAMEMRNQFDSAFESVFENLDKGKKAWVDFGNTLKRDVLKDTYQQFVRPVIQTGLSALMGGNRQTGAPAMSSVGGAPTVASGLAGFALKAFGVPGVSGKAANGAGVNVTIINQTSQPAQGTATQGGGGGSDLTDALEPHVVEIVLKNLESGGSLASAVSGVNGMFS